MKRCCNASLQAEKGFTLIEVLMALTVFALIASLSYGAISTAGVGFEMLSEVREIQEKSGWAGKQLRSDLRYLSAAPHSKTVSPGMQANQANVVPLKIKNDNRGEIELDELWLLVREPGLNGISQVHYYINEDTGHLLRESRLLIARDHVETVRWDFGAAESWAVEVLDKQGNWRQDWNFPASAFVWPRAVRVSMKVDDSSSVASVRQWLLPVIIELDL